MQEQQKTAWRIRRLGVTAVLAVFGLLVGGVSAREEFAGPPQLAGTSAGLSVEKRYGPNPAYRLTPQS